MIVIVIGMVGVVDAGGCKGLKRLVVAAIVAVILGMSRTHLTRFGSRQSSPGYATGSSRSMSMSMSVPMPMGIVMSGGIIRFALETEP